MHGPIFRSIFSIGFEISLVILIAASLKLILGIPMPIAGGFTLLFGLILIPINILYNFGFDKVLQRFEKPYYQRNFRLRLLHAMLYEVLILTLSMPMVMHFLNFDFASALTLNLTIGVIVSLYNVLVTKAFDYEPR